MQTFKASRTTPEDIEVEVGGQFLNTASPEWNDTLVFDLALGDQSPRQFVCTNMKRDEVRRLRDHLSNLLGE